METKQILPDISDEQIIDIIENCGTSQKFIAKTMDVSMQYLNRLLNKKELTPKIRKGLLRFIVARNLINGSPFIKSV